MDTLNVVVLKANLPLMEGETLNTYTRELCKAAKDHFSQKMNLGKASDVWCPEIAADAVVASVYEYKEGSPSVNKMYSAKYSRDTKSGTFSFGDTLEVKPVTRYEPVKTGITQVLKSAFEPVEKSTKTDWTGVI
jgi:hypothetical protein